MKERKNLFDQYKLEKKYHKLLMNEKDSIKRRAIYKEGYDSFYNFLEEKNKKEGGCIFIKNKHFLYKHYIKDKIGVDYGCGYGSFTNGAGKISKRVYGIEASRKIVTQIRKSSKINVTFLCRQSMILPFKSNSIDYFYSTEVLEHLHPDDAVLHLKEVYRCLKRGGVYILLTPNKIFGPSDVSKFFLKKGSSSRGLHLKEYTYDSLNKILSSIGFKKIRSPLFLEYILLILNLNFLFRFILIDIKYKILLEKKLRKIPEEIAEIIRIKRISLIMEK